jgi:hypothetical protein
MAVASASHAMLAFQGRLLKRAIEIAGGWNELCVRIGVSEHSLKMWLDGKVTMPDRVFLAAADVVLQDDIARAGQDRRNTPRATSPEPSTDSVHQPR